MPVSRVRCAVGAVGLVLASAAFGQGPARVRALYTNIPGHPTRVVPGIPGALFSEGTGSQFDRPFGSPDGNRWVIRARLAAPATTANDEVIILGSGLTGTVIVREGSPTGLIAGELLGTIGTEMGVNDAGRVVFSAKTTAATTQDTVVLRWTGSGLQLVAREGSPGPAALGGAYGGTLDSAGILNDALGTAYFRVAPISGGPRDGQMAWVRGSSLIVATGDKALQPLEQLQDPSYSWRTLYPNRFRMDAQGERWVGAGELAAPSGTIDQVMVLTNAVRIQEGSVTPGDFSGRLAAPQSLNIPDVISPRGGHWIARGGYHDSDEFVLADGRIIASTGMAITLSRYQEEVFDDSVYPPTFFLSTINSAGDVIVGGVTNAQDLNANAVLVLNGQRVVLREGEPIDLDGDGLANDDAYVAVFNNDDAFFTESGFLYFAADIRNGAGATIGQGFLRTRICKPDWDGSGVLNSADISLFLADWLTSVTSALQLGDYDRDGEVTSADVSAFLYGWLRAVVEGC